MRRFQTEKLSDFKHYAVGFIELQLECSERVQQTWRKLLPLLQEICLGQADASRLVAATESGQSIVY